MSAMDIDNDVTNVLEVLRSEVDPEFAGVFYELEDLYERKLWYQLTVTLEQNFFKSDYSKGFRLKLYDRFISTFENKVNQLKLIELLLSALEEVETAEEKVSYLENLQKELVKQLESESSKKLNEDELKQAIIFTTSEIANIKLQYSSVEELDGVKKMIDELQVKIDALNTIDNRINASFYKTLSNYHKVQEDYSSFYRTSLLYLACIPDLDALSAEERFKIVREISVSALLGDKIYNFGELIMHDIFDDLDSDPVLKKLLLDLNSGNLSSFTKGLETVKDGAILGNEKFLKMKICIMSLIELIFTKPSNKKFLKFDEILSNINLLSDINEVEYLIMKCLSLKLIKGHINQIAQELEVTWVQPRVMNKDQIQVMKSKLISWNENVVKLTSYMDANGKEVWV